MEAQMEELFWIVAELAGKYTGCDSTSVSYETAERLMEGVLYCVEECRNYAENGLADRGLPIREQYRIGARIVLEKAREVREIYHEMLPYFEDYDVRCLRDTVEKGIPEFLKRYDAKYYPQDTILTLDYPLLTGTASLWGVDAVHQYIRGIRAEQRFLKMFDRNDVTEILRRANPAYEQMIENIGEIALLNAVGHVVQKKPFSEKGFRVEEYEALEDMLQHSSVGELEDMLHTILEKMTEQMGTEVQCYFGAAVKNMAVRLETAVRTKQLDRIFVL